MTRMWSPKKLSPVLYWQEYLREELHAPVANYEYDIPDELVKEATRQGAKPGRRYEKETKG